MKIYYGIKKCVLTYEEETTTTVATKVQLVKSEYADGKIFYNQTKPYKLKKSLKNYQEKRSLIHSYSNCKEGIDLTTFEQELTDGKNIYTVSKSKGRRFAGHVKAHGHRLHSKTRSEFRRKPGATGTFGRSGKVKGTKMAKNIGNQNTYICSKVLNYNDNILTLKGTLAGTKGALVKLIIK